MIPDATIAKIVRNVITGVDFNKAQHTSNHIAKIMPNLIYCEVVNYSAIYCKVNKNFVAVNKKAY